MKISALSLFVTIGLSSLTLVFAAECTSDDLSTISTSYSEAAMSEGASKCPDLATSTEATNYCNDSDCLDYMSSLIDILPDCTSGGVNVRAGLQAAIDYCETGTADTSDVVTGSASSLRTGSASTTASSKTSDKENESTAAPAAAGSSSASSVSVAISSAALAVTFIFAAL
ncbi:hypothetical protein V7S43_017877 [Phytophthora oleae]|uniref:Elicitin n=1 Tax=Phytophthora oleae TaxID=2107226 RepID=A0ABD3EU59_9STRA